MSTEDTPTAAATAWRKSLGYDEEHVHGAAKRCGIQWAPFVGDWFTSWSPRNGNTYAEGTWEHWIVLALHILRDPLTAVVWPDLAVQAGSLPAAPYRYDETERSLTDAELHERFSGGAS